MKLHDINKENTTNKKETNQPRATTKCENGIQRNKSKKKYHQNEFGETIETNTHTHTLTQLCICRFIER